MKKVKEYFYQVWSDLALAEFESGECIKVQQNIIMSTPQFMSTPLGGGHIIFAFSGARCPASHLVSRHFRQ